MTWISHVGRKSAHIEATLERVRGSLDDAEKAGELVRRHLDLSASRLHDHPPVWALTPIGLAGVQARPAVAVRIEPGSDGLLLRTDQVSGFDPTRLTADLDLIAEGDACRLVARWDAAVDLPVPRLARRPAGQVVGRILARLIDELLDQLQLSVREA